MIGSNVNKRISQMKFYLVSPEEIRKMSSIKIITADTYDDDGFPINNGLMDVHMGVIEPGLRCRTCGGKVDECVGHFGHIELAMPIIHVGYIKEIKKYLDSTCSICGRVLMLEEDIKIRRELLSNSIKNENVMKMMIHSKKMMKESAKKMVCPHCGAEQKKISLDKPTTFREEEKKLTPREVRERLERIPEKDLKILGIDANVARPEWIILTVLPVPPVNVRPSITLESGERSEDDLTHKLVDVIRINQRLRDNRDSGAPQLIIDDLWELLQYHVTTYFDNQTSGIPPARHRSGRALKTLTQRLKGKEGRFRSNLSGKRVNFSARTVISPDPFLSINEVGIPWRASKELTVPIVVTRDNIEMLMELITHGSTPKEIDGTYYTGANYIIRSDGRRIKITDKNCEEVSKKLEVGWTVERHLMNGDVVVFNRQPSLHRMSMMAHRVRLMPHNTFRFNLAVCPPYNADFDGDEMNLHILQGEEARAEARVLMLVQQHLLSPRFGNIIIGGIHDHITGMFLLTHNNPEFEETDVLHLLSYTNIEKLPKKFKNTGKEIFSLLLPNDMVLEFKAKICENCSVCKYEKCDIDAYIKINDGQLISGTIDEHAIGAFKNILLDHIVRKYGFDEGRKFIDNMTKLSVSVISLKGFTTSIEDEDIPTDAKNQIKEILIEGVAKSNEFINSYRDDILQSAPGRSVEETLEMEIMKALGIARDEAGKIASKYMGLENPSVIMARSGARASMLNLSQMAGSIGQQSVRGQRLHRGYKKRTLSHFKPDDLGAEARGFVQSSYKSGLGPLEYFFHSMGGREGLVDTAVRTSRSGYMQRRLINALEDLKVSKKRRVVNTSGQILQFLYGEDGIDPTRAINGNAVSMEKILIDIIGNKYYESRRDTE